MNILTAGRPLASSEAEALAMDGYVVRHYKGGIYRVLSHGVFQPRGFVPEGCRLQVWREAIHTETLEPVMIHLMTGMGGLVQGAYWVLPQDLDKAVTRPAETVVIYEHLWPHRHQTWVRPLDLFRQPTADGTPRFAQVGR